MKILWDNYLDDSTITATSEDSLYPVSNVTHNFLEKKYMAVGTSTRITIIFPETRTVSMIAYGFSNVTTSTKIYKIIDGASNTLKIVDGASEIKTIDLQSKYTLRTLGGSFISSGTLSVGDDININYITPTDCGRVVIDVASSELVYIGGIAVGDPLILDYISTTPDLVQELRSAYSTTVGGQVIGRNVRSLKSWNVSVPIIDNDKRQEMEQMFRTVQNYKTFFSSLYDENEDLERPIFCHFTGGGSFKRRTHTNDFTTDFTITEAR